MAAARPAGPPPTMNTSVLCCEEATRPPFSLLAGLAGHSPMLFRCLSKLLLAALVFAKFQDDQQV
jgi:hypothetical protein